MFNIWFYHQEMEAPAVDLRAVRPPKADIQNKENKTCSVCQVSSPHDISHFHPKARCCILIFLGGVSAAEGIH